MSASPDHRDRDLSAFIGKEKAEKVTALFEKVMPILYALGSVMNILFPYLHRAYSMCRHLWELAQPYHPLDLSSVLGGLVLAFFGSRYVLVFAAVEAARLTGFDAFQKSFAIIYNNYQRVHIQSLLDDARDDDKDGVPDVEELSRKELFTRKGKLFLATVNPEELSTAGHALFVLFMGIIATLRMQFAQVTNIGFGSFNASTYIVTQRVLASDGDPGRRHVRSCMAPCSKVRPACRNSWRCPRISSVGALCTQVDHPLCVCECCLYHSTRHQRLLQRHSRRAHTGHGLTGISRSPWAH